MPNVLQKLFLPLFRLVHWPESKAYMHERKQWYLEQIFASRHLADVDSVLEVGCGDGWVGHRLADRYGQVVGFDINPNRLRKPQAANLSVLAADAEHLPFPEHSFDLIVSVAVLEHLPDAPRVLNSLTRMLTPGGRMVHVVPHSGWKVMQWLFFWPNIVRKHVRSITRAISGQKKQKTQKYYQGRETNNPTRQTRRVWYRKFYPRIHGEYDSNLDEFLQWLPGRWVKLFDKAGLNVVEQIPLGVTSPYGFGVSQYIRRRLLKRRLPCMTAFVLEPQLEQIQEVCPKPKFMSSTPRHCSRPDVANTPVEMTEVAGISR